MATIRVTENPNLHLDRQRALTQSADPLQAVTAANVGDAVFVETPESGQDGSANQTTEYAAVAAPGGKVGTPLFSADTDGIVEPEKESVPAAKTRSRILQFAWDFLFYAALVILVLAIGANTGASGKPRVFFGYSFFTVLTSSMQRELPQGSFIVVKQVDSETIRIGDDVTYMSDETTPVTHRVVGIEENYYETGKRGFQTQGIENAAPDQDIVNADNIVGVVVFSLPVLGAVLSVIRDNLVIALIMIGIVVVLSVALRALFKKEENSKPAVGVKEGNQSTAHAK